MSRRGLILLVALLPACLRGGFEPPRPRKDANLDARLDRQPGEGKAPGEGTAATDRLFMPDGATCPADGGVAGPGCSCERCDANHNGHPDVGDLSLLSSCWCGPATGSCAAADFNGDGLVNNDDLACLSRFYGRPCKDGGP